MKKIVSRTKKPMPHCFLEHFVPWLAERDSVVADAWATCIASAAGDMTPLIQVLRDRFLWIPAMETPGIPTPSQQPALQGAAVLAQMYEQELAQQFVKKNGAVYTPVPVADLVIERALSRHSLRTGDRILDPACGSGIFLIRLIQAQPEVFAHNESPAIFALDIDESSLRLAQILVAGVLAEAQGRPTELYQRWQTLVPQFIRGNYLVTLNDIERSRVCSDTIETPRASLVPLDKPFDLIIGNPPYGMSRNEQLSPDENKILMQKFDAWRSGKLNKYMLFLAQSVEALAPDGVAAFIVPNAWTGIQSASVLRQRLLDAGALREVIHFTERPFPNANVEAVAVVMQHAVEPTEGIALRHISSISQRNTTCIETISRAAIDSYTRGRIPLFWDAQASNMHEAIWKTSVPLGGPHSAFHPAIALQAYARGKGSPPQSAQVVSSHPFHHEQPVNEHCIPYLEGRDVVRYGLQWSGRYLEYGPWLAEPQQRDRFCGPRIIVREVLGAYPSLLLATFVRDEYLYNKSCLHIRTRPSHTNHSALLALLGILNSALASYVILMTGRKSQRRLFPKVVNADLFDFPIPRALFESADSLAALVAERLEKESALEALEKEILMAACKMYELSKPQINYLQQFSSPIQRAA